MILIQTLDLHIIRLTQLTDLADFILLVRAFPPKRSHSMSPSRLLLEIFSPFAIRVFVGACYLSCKVLEHRSQLLYSISYFELCFAISLFCTNQQFPLSPIEQIYVNQNFSSGHLIHRKLPCNTSFKFGADDKDDDVKKCDEDLG